MKFNKKNKVFLILGILLLVVLFILIYMLTFSNYKKSLTKFDNSLNYSMKVELKIGDNIKSYINSNIDNDKKTSINHFYAIMNDIDYGYKYFTYYDKNKYLSYKEQATQYINTEIDEPEYLKLIKEINGFNLDKRKLKNKIFKYATYTGTINYEKIVAILNIYKEYFGIDKNYIENKNYNVLSTVLHNGYLNKIMIDLSNSITINEEKYKDATLTIYFNNYGSTIVDEVE